MMAELGDSLVDLAAATHREFVLCAPFAKRAVVDRIVSMLPEGVNLRLYTRWRPEEVAAGVSDTGVLPIIRDRGGTVFLQDRLHAKFYRNETRALLGSANLTATALGWTPTPNIELLVDVKLETVAAVEYRLSVQSHEATDELANEVDTIAKSLELPGATIPSPSESPGAPVTIWIPQLRMPSDLYAAYSRGLAALTSRSAGAAAIDLLALDLPPGLDKKQFYLLVGHRLKHQGLFRAIDEYLLQPRRFGEVQDKVSQITGLDRGKSSDAWQTVMRWMLEFLPHRYNRKVGRHSEVLSRTGLGKESL